MKKNNILIVIAHFNNPEGLVRSLNSIDEDNICLDVLIVDDGSSLKFKEEQIRKIYKLGKVFFEYLEVNSGQGVAANLGLEKAKELEYQFISRLDCGDICKKNKYRKQLEYLLDNPDIKLIGTWANVVTEDGEFLHHLKHPVSYEKIKKLMYINSMFLNPSVVFRTEVLEKINGYQVKYRRAAQDYAFFFEVIKHYKAENYPEILMDYVVESHSVSTTKRKLQVKNRMKIIIENFYFGYYPIYGLLRSLILLFISRDLSTKIKSKLN